MKYHLAQINIAKMIAPLDSPVMAEFVANLEPINSLGENSPGFVWRLKDDSNTSTAVRVYDDDFIIVNMSVWENAEALFQFVYKSRHTEFLKRRKEWFEKMPEMQMVMWYVPEGHTPTVNEAVERLNYLRKHGATPFAFTFKQQFPVEEATSEIKSQNP
jgi:hypothetical protein